jgi:glycosyltransferase involved in cell wall biosynthesis
MVFQAESILRVLHVIPSIARRYGGPSAAIVPMTEALAAQPGLHVEVATTDADGPGRLDPGQLDATRTPVHLFRRTCSEQWKLSLGLWRWLYAHAGDYDLLHVHALWSFSTTAACAAARRHRVPVVVRPCGMLSSYTWSRSGWKKRLYWTALERRNLLTARCFHVTSRAEAAEVEAVVPRARVMVIPQGTDPQAWQAERRPNLLRQLCGAAAGERPIVLFLSRLHPKKGVVDYLLPAFARLRSDAFLAIAGGADEHAPEYAERVRHTVEQLGLSQRVALLGPVAAADRWTLFDGAALFVLPSLSENFGIVLTEAMARGVAVVASEGVQGAEHVRAAGAGRVVELDQGALADALDELLGSEQQTRQMGSKGQRYVQAHLSWPRVAASIADMYRAIVEK